MKIGDIISMPCRDGGTVVAYVTHTGTIRGQAVLLGRVICAPQPWKVRAWVWCYAADATYVDRGVNAGLKMVKGGARC